MPQIPASQFDRLLQQDMPGFFDKTLAVVRESRPTYRQSDNMLCDSIRAGFKRALQHGLTTDEQLMEYVLVMFASAPNFDQHPMIARVLGDQRFPIEVRWERIFEEDFDDFWGDISEPEFYDGEYWNDPTQPKVKPLAPDEQPAADDWAELVVALKHAQGPGPSRRKPTKTANCRSVQETDSLTCTAAHQGVSHTGGASIVKDPRF